ncbi:uncharacterized protein LOC126571751 [Anopheles aquasalis]|uniref:uncharacterized protein LOC126571751 n=1 Tax=Anopheles aquasalis TaxID=42839 RepID=UPI00215AE939|nr:uncharacterized protein LOC126571751 [Anopheles aquasalis]
MFLVVEIVNDKGEKEWKVAPKQWVCTTKNSRRTVLLWPHEMGSERQKQLARDGSTKPAKNWSRKECVILQESFTDDEADAALKELLAQRSTSSATMSLLGGSPATEGDRKEEHSEDHLLTYDPENEEQVSTIPVELSSYKSWIALQDPDVGMLAAIKTELNTLLMKNDRIESQNARIEKQNAEIELQNIRIETDNSNMLRKLNLLEKRLNKLDSKQLKNAKNVGERSTFTLHPIETQDQLKELEKKLSDRAFRAKMVAWLMLNVDGNRAQKRMSNCLKLLFSRELLADCTWGRIHLNGIQTAAMREQRNIVNLFKAIGTTRKERIDDKKIALFFSRKLKNVRQRLHSDDINEAHNQQILDQHMDPYHDDSSNDEPLAYAESMEDESDTLFEVEILK